MVNGSNTVIEDSLILGVFTLGTNRDLGGSPTIQNNAFMGEVAFRQTSTGDSAPEKPVAIGRNYYGDSAGLFKNKGKNHGFLGYHSGHTGALDQYWDDSWLAIAPHLTTSPVSGARRDTRVLPKFWVNGVIVGQNTLAHDGSVGPLVKGRDTLVSVHLVASDNNLQGVRVYARWNGQEIEAANNRNNLPLHRDHSLYSKLQVKAGLATYNFILPGVDDGSTDVLNMPVEVFLDVSGVAGFEADAYPGEDRLLFSRELFFTAYERPFRIAVQPVEVLGVFGGSYGEANAAGVMRVLRDDLPDMLPIPADKVDLIRFPMRRFWSPSAFITEKGLLARIAAGMGMALGYREALSYDTPDFIVVVLPQGLTGKGFDGVATAFSARILFVAEHKADAVLHELGHGIGLYTGWGNEQYELHPPSGLPVTRATRFHTELPGRLRIDHLPAVGDFWYDLPDSVEYYYYDIMGNVGPIWTRPETVESFYNWFRAILKSPQTSSPSIGPNASSNTRRILIAGAVEPAELHGESLMPDTLFSFDITGLGFPDLSPTASYDYWFAHVLRAYDAEGTETIKHGRVFTLTEGERVFLATFDLPDETVYFCIERAVDKLIVENTLIYCAHPAGLQSTTLLSPQPGATIGPQFEAEWAIETTTSVDQADLSHVLYYKTAPDGPWQFGLMTQGTNISVPSSFLPDTDYLALRLLSSDGLVRTEHVVEGLKVDPRPPQVTIFSPRNGDQSTANVLWELSADAEDFSGEGLQPGRWHSSIQGDLGEGPDVWQTLITGTHELSYEVMSNNGLTESAIVTVTVHNKMTSLDLGLGESDLTLHNASIDPAGYTPVELIPGEVNIFNVRVRNQGVDASARVRLFVRGPEDAQDVLIGEQGITLAPFEVAYLPFDFEPNAIGIYEVRVLIDQVTPADPDMSNNERRWSFPVAGYQNGQQDKVYLPLIIQGP